MAIMPKPFITRLLKKKTSHSKTMSVFCRLLATRSVTFCPIKRPHLQKRSNRLFRHIKTLKPSTDPLLRKTRKNSLPRKKRLEKRYRNSFALLAKNTTRTRKRFLPYIIVITISECFMAVLLKKDDVISRRFV